MVPPLAAPIGLREPPSPLGNKLHPLIARADVIKIKDRSMRMTMADG